MKIKKNLINKKIKILTTKKVDLNKMSIYGNFNYDYKVLPFRFKNKFGLISNKGDIICYGFNQLESFSEGVGVYITETGENYLNYEGKTILKDAELCSLFKNGLGIFLKDEKYGFLDIDGNIISYGFDFLDEFNYSIAIFKKDGKYGYVHNSGKIIYSGADICYHFRNGIGIANKNNKFTVINSSGEILINNITMYNRVVNNIMVFEKNKKQGWMTSSGKIIGYGYEKCYDFKNKHFGLFRNKGYGLINNYGEIILEDTGLYRLSNFIFKKDFVEIKTKTELFWIDKYGKVYTEKPF